MKVRGKDGKLKDLVYDEAKLYRYGINRLSTREWGRNELKQRMMRLQPEEQIVNSVLDKLESQGYLNDDRRMSSMLRIYSQKESISKVSSRMRDKGFSKEQIEEHLSSIEGFSCDDETEKATILLISKFKEYDRDARDKMMRFLAGKGFSYSIISNAVKRFADV